MSVNKQRVLVLVMLGVLTGAAKAESTYDATINGKSCADRPDLRSPQRDCDYKIGDGFWLSIAAVGTPMANAHFMKSDFHGKYYASFLPGSYCVMVSKGKSSGKISVTLDIAYVSLNSGNVYKKIIECESGK